MLLNITCILVSRVTMTQAELTPFAPLQHPKGGCLTGDDCQHIESEDRDNFL